MIDIDYLQPLINKVRNDTIFETIKRLFEEIKLYLERLKGMQTQGGAIVNNN